MRWLFIFPLLVVTNYAHSFDYPYTLRSPKALLMGDAFTAVNDDEFTLFYNPASLARHKADFSLTPFNPQFNGSNLLSDIERFQNFPSEPSGVADVLLDYPAHASAGIAPGFKMFNVGVTFLASESYDILLRNRAHPMLDVDVHSDKGVLLGVGIPLGPSRIGRKSLTGAQTSLGLSAKYLERTGVRDTIALSGPVFTGALGQSELNDVVKSLGNVKGIGFGFDAGVEHINRQGNSQFVVGLTALDITGTDFTEEGHPDDLQVTDIKDQINLGMAAGQDFKFFHYILSADVRGLNEQIDFGKRIRLGAEVGIPGLKLLGGVNSGYYSFGATLDLMIMKFTAGLYDIELGSRYQQLKSRRFVIYLSLFDFSFDA